MTVEIDALPNDQPIGWADTQISRDGAGAITIGTASLLCGTDFTIGGLAERGFRTVSGQIIGRASGQDISAISSSGIFAASHKAIGFAGAITPGSTPDVQLWRDAADTLAQRRGTNPQAFYLYNTYTDASNYERGGIWWDANRTVIGSGQAGTGGSRNVHYVTAGGTHSWDYTLGTSLASLTTSGFLLNTGSMSPSSDNARDVGWTGGRWRDLHLGRDLYATGLPTSDPSVAGQVWNDSGTLKISAG